MALMILVTGALAMFAASWVALTCDRRDLDDVYDDLTDEELDELG